MDLPEPEINFEESSELFSPIKSPKNEVEA